MPRYISFLLVALMTIGLGNTIQAQQQFNRENFPPAIVAQMDSKVLVTVQSTGTPFAGFSVFNPYQRTITQMGGTGFIARSDGYIICSPSVVRDSKMIKVTWNHKDYDATLQMIDDYYDLALIKIDATGLPYVKFGDSSLMHQGSPVVVMGSPAGLDQTLTYGFVTNIRDYRIVGPNGYDGMLILDGLVIDAALHSGVECGPVFNSKGECISIVTRKASGPENIGYTMQFRTLSRW